MAAAFQDLHGIGYDEIVLVGSDLPKLPRALISRALRLFRTRTPTATLGPSTDGGYFLIGLRRPVVALFRGVSWSTPFVLDQTRTLAAAMGLSVRLLVLWYDVDDAESLARASRENDRGRVAERWTTRRARPG
jgi:hypothetical protein